MNRRQFIAGAMAAVVASYVGGEFILDESKLTWRESFTDYDRFYNMAVEWTDKAGKTHGMGVRLPIHHLKNITNKKERIRNDMKRMLLKWLEEHIQNE